MGELLAAKIATIHNDPRDPTPSWVTGALLSHVDQDFATALLGFVGAGTDAPFVAAEVRHIGSATATDVDGGSPVGGRTARFTLGFVSADPARFDEAPGVAYRLFTAVDGWLSAESNVNFGADPRSSDGVVRAWPAGAYERLLRVRHRYDPYGIFG